MKSIMEQKILAFFSKVDDRLFDGRFSRDYLTKYTKKRRGKIFEIFGEEAYEALLAACNNAGEYTFLNPFDGSKNIYLRGLSSDVPVFIQIFVNEEYSGFIDGLQRGQTILDLGAYTGMSAIYFLGNGFNVVCVEPMKPHQDLIERNLAGYDYKLLKGAISDREGVVKMSGAGWDCRVSEDGVPVPTFDMVKLVEDYGVKYIKCDIEGHERSLRWEAISDKIECVALEFHDHLFPRSSEPARKAFKDWKSSTCGENFIYRKIV